MREEQAVFDQLNLSDFKKWSSTTLNTFDNYRIIIRKYSLYIRISWV